MNRFRAVSTYLILGASKACSISSPLFIGYAADAISGQNSDGLRLARRYIVIFCALGAFGKMLRELQAYVYLKVRQTAYIEMAEATFQHIHSLSLNWHLNKKMGHILRSMDRGVESANSVVSYIFLYLIPTLIECGVVCFIFLTHFGKPMLAAIAITGISLYLYVTYYLTMWRKKLRKKKIKHDNDFHDKASISSLFLVSFIYIFFGIYNNGNIFPP